MFYYPGHVPGLDQGNENPELSKILETPSPLPWFGSKTRTKAKSLIKAVHSFITQMSNEGLFCAKHRASVIPAGHPGVPIPSHPAPGIKTPIRSPPPIRKCLTQQLGSGGDSKCGPVSASAHVTLACVRMQRRNHGPNPLGNLWSQGETQTRSD